VNSSKLRQTFAVSHIDPYWTDDGVSRSIDVFTRKFEPDEIDSANTYSVRTQGLGVRFGIPYTEEDRIFLGASFEMAKYGGNEDLWPNRIKEEKANFGTSSLDAYLLTLGWSRDSRDSALAPTRGRQQYINLDYATPAGEMEFVRVSYGHQWFYPLTRSVTLALNGELGWGEGLGSKPFPTLKNYYVGGIGSVRGFEGGGIGRRDEDGASLGGNRKVVFNSELLFPLPGMAQDRTIRLFTYFDAGAVWREDEKVDFGQLRASVGVGLSWLSPVGPLKLSIGNAIKKEDGDRLQRFQFQIGTGF
jgi:outer membrane protein insertion porin family